MVVRQIIHKQVAKLAIVMSGLTRVECRRHPRAKVKWPVVMTTPDGLVDGQTQNLSLGGALIRCPKTPNLKENFRLVMTANARLILVTAEVAWTNFSNFAAKPKFGAMGIRFTSMSSDDRRFLKDLISHHF